MSSEKPKSDADAVADADSVTDAGAGDGPVSPSPTGTRPVTRNNSGRVTFDDRGNAVWEWAGSTGKFEAAVTTGRIKKLENHTLALVDDEAPSAPPTAPPTVVQENRKGVKQGYSPYDSGLLVKADAEVKRTKRKDLRRLSEWLKLREQANRNKQTDDQAEDD